MSLKNLELICMGDSRVGYGHIRRTQTLANAFRKKGYKPILINISELQTNRLDQKYYGGESIQIIDIPTAYYKNIENILRIDSNKFALDYFGNDEKITRINIYDHIKIDHVKKYVGYEYVLMRNDFVRNSKLFLPNIKSTKKDALIMLGGADINRQGEIAAEILTKKGINVTLVKGPLMKRRRYSGAYRILRNPNNIYELFIRSQLVVVNGGGSLFESIYLKKPTIVLPQTKEELAIALDLYDKKQILDVGLKALKKFKWSRLVGATRFNFNNIDSHGANRIIDIVLGARKIYE